jgi:hypothetical protein
MTAEDCSGPIHLAALAFAIENRYDKNLDANRHL